MELQKPSFKCLLANGSQAEDLFTVHFNQSIPRLVGISNRGFFGVPFGPISCIPKKRVAIARRLAVLNQGRIATELIALGKVFAELIEDLNRIDGLISITNRNPYRLDYKVGFLFDPTQVAERIVTALHQHFFWEQELILEISQDLRFSKPELDPEKKQAIKAKEPIIDTP